MRKKRRFIPVFLTVFLTLSNYFIMDGTTETNSFQPVLSSYIVSPTETAPGGTVSFQFVFANRNLNPSKADDKIFLHFIDPAKKDAILWQFDHEPSVPTRFWMNGQPIEDGPLPITVPDTTADGAYAIRLGVWNPANGIRSMDVILPVSLTIDRNRVPKLDRSKPQMNYTEARRLHQSLLLRRFMTGNRIEMDNEQITVQLNPTQGLLCVRDQDSGSVWQSSLDSIGLGYAMAEDETRKTVRVPLNSLTVISESNTKIVLQKEYQGSVLIEIQLLAEKNSHNATLSWKMGSGWTLHRIDWNGLLWTTDAMGGGAVIPRLIGEWFPARNPLQFRKTFGTYAGWGGLHIPMVGMLQEKACALLSWDSPNITATLRSVASQSVDCPGSRQMILDLSSSEPAGEFTISVCDGNSYVTLAQCYREIAQKKGLLVGLDQKARKNPDVQKLFGAAEFKPFVCIRYMQDKNGQSKERVENPYTETDCIQLAKHLHDDLGLAKVLFVLAGWIHRGYDNQHPDILPAAPEIGGDDGVVRISEAVRSYNYLFGLHDNYQDMYDDAPSWDSSLIMMDKNGDRMKGGVWAGGQCWLMASNRGYELAQRNLPLIKKIFSPNAYFIDTTYAAPLYESFDPKNPLTRNNDMKYKLELSQYAVNQFGVHGSETGVAFGVPVSHYFEGILSGKPLIQDFPNPGAEEIPLFPLVFHGCVAMYTHQGDRTGMSDAHKILKHLVLGEMPLYDIAPHQYWKQTIPEPSLSDPNYCFARGHGGWGENKHPMDRFIKNTYEFLSPVAEAVAALPMTDHKYLKEDRSVEFSRFGEHWQVVVNYGPEDYQYRQTILPPMGFIVLGPDFLAQHFYPEFSTQRTKLVVKMGDKQFVGFQ